MWGGKSGCLNMVGYGSYLQVGNGAKLKIGDSFINREVKIICNKSITIGDDCIIAMGTVIRDNDGGNHQIFAPGYENAKPIIIGNHVWLGENVMILKGVTIGEGGYCCSFLFSFKRCSATYSCCWLTCESNKR